MKINIEKLKEEIEKVKEEEVLNDIYHDNISVHDLNSIITKLVKDENAAMQQDQISY